MSDKEALEAAFELLSRYLPNPLFPQVNAALATLHSEIERRDAVIEAAEKLYESVGMLDMSLRDGLPLTEAWSGAFGADVYGAMARYREALATLKDSQPDENFAYQEMRDRRMEEEGW